MLLKDNKKNLVTVIMKKMTEPKPEMESYNAAKGAELDNSSACDACAEKMLKAIQSKNPKMLSSALKEFFELMEEEEEYKEEVSEESSQE